MKIMRFRFVNLVLPLISAAVAAGGCSHRSIPVIEPGGGDPGGGGHMSGGVPSPTGKLDILFMVDDSASMAPLQAKLKTQIPAFLNALANPTTLAKPDLHVAVVSSSFGGGAWANVAQCQSGSHPGDDQGNFQQGPGGAGSGACPMLHAGETFLKSGDGTAANPPNFDGDLSTALNCMAALGDGGCGFEAPFASVYYALAKGKLLPGPTDQTHDANNGGFLRTDAQLAVIMLTNEDDCSVAFNSLLLDPGVNSVMDPSGLGALTSYRCNEFGHLCAGSPPPHGFPTSLPAEGVTLTSCVSAEDAGKTDPLLRDPNGDPDPTMGHLWPTVSDLATFLKSLKANPNDVFLAAIAGPTVDANGGSLYKVVPVDNPSTGEVDPMIAHSCTQPTTTGQPEYADPAVRIKQLVDDFGSNGVFYPICSADFQGSMTGIAASMRAQLQF